MIENILNTDRKRVAPVHFRFRDNSMHENSHLLGSAAPVTLTKAVDTTLHCASARAASAAAQDAREVITISCVLVSRPVVASEEWFPSCSNSMSKSETGALCLRSYSSVLRKILGLVEPCGNLGAISTLLG